MKDRQRMLEEVLRAGSTDALPVAPASMRELDDASCCLLHIDSARDLLGSGANPGVSQITSYYCRGIFEIYKANGKAGWHQVVTFRSVLAAVRRGLVNLSGQTAEQVERGKRKSHRFIFGRGLINLIWLAMRDPVLTEECRQSERKIAGEKEKAIDKLERRYLEENITTQAARMALEQLPEAFERIRKELIEKQRDL